MVYHFVILSDEVEDFRREIDIDASATFMDLQDIILKTCNYKKDQMTSFFICAGDWSKDYEITMVDMNDNDPALPATKVMERTHLDDTFGKEAGAKLMFLFDPMCERYLYMQLKSLEEKRHVMQPEVTLTKGKAPKQIEDFDKLVGGIDEDMYGSDDFDPDEMDADGYQSLDDIEGIESGDY